MLNQSTKNLKTNTPPQNNEKWEVPSHPSLGSFSLGFHLGPEASAKIKTAKSQRETASALQFGQDKVEAVNKCLGTAWKKKRRTLDIFFLDGKPEVQISFLESACIPPLWGKKHKWTESSASQGLKQKQNQHHPNSRSKWLLLGYRRHIGKDCLQNIWGCEEITRQWFLFWFPSKIRHKFRGSQSY